MDRYLLSPETWASNIPRMSRVCEASGIGPAEEAAALRTEADELRRILGSTIWNTKRRSLAATRPEF